MLHPHLRWPLGLRHAVTSAASLAPTRRGDRPVSTASAQSLAQLQSCQLGDKHIASIRNIGIVAHIDAGKTTTTERMLFYAGKVKKIGEVDVGTTTTDYMEEEMARGITITSAAVTLEWQGHTVNLIDTPGHADFTVEVERSLRVVDGVVALFDASAGVQAQSYTVLRQARKFETPVLAFINKMDKTNANFEKAVKSIRDKLAVVPVLIQLPLSAADGDFEGVVDVVALTTIRFTGPNGAAMVVAKLSTVGDAYLMDTVERHRKALVEVIADRDDLFSEKYLMALEAKDGDETAACMSIAGSDLQAAIRRVTIATASAPHPVMPVLCGAARRDQGVQPLLDAVAAYLPSPADRLNLFGYNRNKAVVPLPKPSNLPSQQTIALVFKIIHTLFAGKWAALCFFRVYSGRVYPKQALNGFGPIGTASEKYEVMMDKVYTMHANNPIEVPFVGAGSIGAAYLEMPFTGDTLIRSPVQLENKPATLVGSLASRSASGEETSRQEQAALDAADVLVQRLEGITPPPPAISFCLEAPADRLLGTLERALECLTREDPSLLYSKNEHRQIILSGMGELHLDIVLSRLNREYQVPCKLLRAMVEYREGCSVNYAVENVDATVDGVLVVSASFRVTSVLAASSSEGEGDSSDDSSSSSSSSEGASVVSVEQAAMVVAVNPALESRAKVPGQSDADAKAEQGILREFVKTLESNLQLCSKCGPLAGLPQVGLTVTLHSCKKLGTGTTAAQLEGAARQLLREVLYACRLSKLVLFEPMMRLHVTLTDATFFGDVISCINSKGAVSVDTTEDCKEVVAVVPMRNVIRFTMDLRKVAKGNGYFWMVVDHYRPVTDEKVRAAILYNRGITD